MNVVKLTAAYRALLLLLCVAAVCVPRAYSQSATWDIIQEQVLDVNCIQCHVEGSSFAVQSGLVLTADQAYDNLIDVVPNNPQAAEDGLVLVNSVGGFPAPHLSYFWEKINATNQEHFYTDHPEYGALMPLGLPPLTNGEIAFITAWIEAGAPETGIVADPDLLNDVTRYEPPEFIPLDPPENGIQFRVGPFDVWPAEVNDREFLFYEPLPTTEEVYVSGYEISMRPGSHHFILYNYPDGDLVPENPREYRDLRAQDGTGNILPLLQINYLFPFRFFVGTQTPYVRFDFPEGIALELPPGSGFDLNSHYVNRGDSSFTGEVYANLYTVPREDVQHVARPGNFNNQDLLLPPNRETTISRVFQFSETRHLIQIWAHAHERMTEFRIERVGGERDGELIYWTNDWEHPPLLNLDPPLTFEQGEQVRLVTKYNNTTNEPIRFGLLSSEEMQFMFYIYFTGALPTSSEPESASVERFSLSENFPEPFADQTSFEYHLPRPAQVKIHVHDVAGRMVAELVNGTQAAGTHHVTWDASGVAAGVYYISLQAGTFRQSRPAFLIR